jgi:FkbM family methyltransferase
MDLCRRGVGATTRFGRRLLPYVANPSRIEPRFFGGARGRFEFGGSGYDALRPAVEPCTPLLKVAVRSLQSRVIYLRAETSDATVAWDTFVGRYHLPPRSIEPKVIWDLGTNIGLTVAHFAARYPRALIFGVEPETASFRQARINTSPWSDRVVLIHGAVWYQDGVIGFVSDQRHASGAHVDAEASASVPAHSLNTLLADIPRVDFMKIDIEGAECPVLTRNTEWAHKVASLKVEVHPPYSLAQCRRDLLALGFSAKRYRRAVNMVVATRP